MFKRRQVDPVALRRDLRNHQQRQRHRLREALFLLAPFLFAAFEVVRVATAPIRGTAAWFVGVLVGLGAGGVGAASWFLVARRGVAARAFAGMAAVALLLALLTSSGSRGHAAPDITSGYLAGAVTYDAIGLGSMGILLGPARRRRFR